ncbi:DUF3040 domain-containing protein [Cellulomonas citrea]|uniref:DUF3040 domain-containing protein n=1 Tax=Cellulomonas citrea TaxID=1909423 RepID=UPI001359C4CD|nr:DUF3040 domain-containing protein [Cellulomonas citrea]
MPLSEYEQRVLEQMERHLSTDDPRLANTLTQRGRRPATRYAVAVVGSVLGLLLLVLGAHYSAAWLGAIGFVLMFGSVAFAFARGGSGRKQGAEAGTPAAGGATRSRRTFMNRMEERWDRRREQGDR